VLVCVGVCWCVLACSGVHRCVSVCVNGVLAIAGLWFDVVCGMTLLTMSAVD